MNKVWVAYSKDGWRVKISGSDASIATFSSKNDALERAQQIADEQGAELLSNTLVEEPNELRR